MTHRRREDPEREPLTKGRSYNPHIVLLRAPTPILIRIPKNVLSHRLSSNARTLSRPKLPYTGLPLFLQAQSEPMLIYTQLLTNFTPSHSPQIWRQILTALLQACTPNELLFLSQTIVPLLKRDFLISLPLELGLHVLTSIDDPRALIRASLVRKWWHRMVRDESKQHQHRLGNLKDASRGDQPFSAILREDVWHSDRREEPSGLSSPPTDSSLSRPREVSNIFSYRRHFKIWYIIRTCSSH